MDINYPPQFDDMLSYLKFIKGDILSYLNVKCLASSLDIYSEFVLAMLMTPLVWVTLFAFYSVQSWRAQRSDGTGDKPSQGLSERLGDSGSSDPFEVFGPQDNLNVTPKKLQSRNSILL